MEFLKIKTQTDLAEFLNFKDIKKMNFILYGNAGELYEDFEIKKRKGGFRRIQKPKSSIARVQHVILSALESVYKPSNCVYAYCKNRSSKDSAYIHIGQKLVLSIDIKDFFPSIHFGRVRGMFTKKPFFFPDDVAQRLATFVTYNGELPQGACTSPIISNLIMRGFDKELESQCKVRDLAYTRYADDITISTKNESFPPEVGFVEFVDGNPISRVGSLLKVLFQRNSFQINEKKTFLTNTQFKSPIINGIVVKEKTLALKKSYQREIRSLIYIWGKYGKNDLIASLEKYKGINKNYVKIDHKKAEEILWGKINYLGYVYGFDSSKFRKLYNAFNSLAREIKPKIPKIKKNPNRRNIVIHVEGKTDVTLMKSALKYFKSKNIYKNINPTFKFHEGESILLNNLKKSLGNFSKTPALFLFDSDVSGTVEKVTPTKGSVKDWGYNIYSTTLQNPIFRSTSNKICIELMFPDEFIKKLIVDGRRLFLPGEFDEFGIHKNDSRIVWRNPSKKTLIIDNNVLSISDKKILSLPKEKFSSEVGKLEFSKIGNCFDGFEKTFELIRNLVETKT